MTKVGLKEFIRERKILSFFLLVIVLFAVWNVIWFSFITVKYKKYIEVVPKNFAGVHVITKEDGFMYSVKKPGYLSLTGNLVVKDTETQEALFIWPKIIDSYYIYGLKYIKDGIVYRVYIDKNGKISEELALEKGYDSTIIQDVEKREKEIQDYFSRAYKMWGIDQSE